MHPNAQHPISNKLALGAGCYWGTNKFIVKDFQKLFPGSIESAKVGFMNPLETTPRKTAPTYREVCSGVTGYVEVLDVTLKDPTPELLTELFRFFYKFHDPTTKNRQGNDRGTQYASAIFYGDDTQKEIAMVVRDELQAAIENGKVPRYQHKVIETGIVGYTKFYEAHEAHQDYLEKNPSGYCNHYYRFKQWPVEDQKAIKKQPDQESPVDIEKEKRKGPLAVLKRMLKH